MAMAADENSESESDTKEPPFEKITINTDYKIKTSLEEPPTDLELKPLPDNLEYVFLKEPSFLPVIISSKLSAQNKSKLVSVLKKLGKPLLGKRQTFEVDEVSFYTLFRGRLTPLNRAFMPKIGSHEADECEQKNPSEQVCLSGGDIYNNPSLLRFYQNDDTSPWGNNKRKEKGDDGPEWNIRSKFEDELANFVLEKKFHTKGIGDMLVQHRISTQDPPFPAPPRPATDSFTEGTSNPPFPSRLKKQKKDDEDKRLLSIFKQIHINLSFLEAMIHMPKGAKVLNDLISHKKKLEKAASSVKLSEECSTIIQRSLPQKEGDLEEEEEDSNKALVVSFYPRTEPVEPLELKASNNRLKPSSVEPPKLELKEFPEQLELLEVFQNHIGAIAWSIADIKGINSSFCTHKILMEDKFKPCVQPQRRVNPNSKEIVKNEVINLLDAGLIYPISGSPWVSPVQVVPKKGGMTVVKNKMDELIPQ
ncbi:hypothetical protein Tco_0291635 [Tanacetum coccineum]